MICPNCKYEYYESYSKKKSSVIGEKGDFFFIATKHGARMKRHPYKGPYSTTEKADLWACPKCGIAFIDVNEEARKPLFIEAASE